MPAHIDLEAAGEFLDTVYVHGTLYNLGSYPGLVGGEQLVKGIRYRLDDVSVVPDLDAFEDINADDPINSLYCRVKRVLLDEHGQPTGEEAWVYWYNRSIAGRTAIESGDWPLKGSRSR